MCGEFNGNTVLVTGGARGIGEGIVRAFAKHGARVAINFCNAETKARELADELQRDYNTESLLLQGDVGSSTDMDRIFDTLQSKFGRLDILVNNAGWESVGHAIDLSEKEIDRAFNINLKGPLLCCQRAARIMETHGGGVILHNLSIHDAVPRKGLVHYCSAKAGALMMIQCLALELAEYQIRVIGVSPGAIETDMNREEIEKFGRHLFNQSIPMGRVGNIDEIADLFVALAGPASTYVTGTTIYADGGYRLNTIPYDPRPARRK